MLINIKKKISIIYSLIKKLIYSGNIDKIKEDTWKSKKIAKKFYIKHKKKNYLFENSFSKIFTSKIKKNQTSFKKTHSLKYTCSIAKIAAPLTVHL